MLNHACPPPAKVRQRADGRPELLWSNAEVLAAGLGKKAVLDDKDPRRFILSSFLLESSAHCRRFFAEFHSLVREGLFL